MNLSTQLSGLLILTCLSISVTAGADSPEFSIENWERALKSGNTEALNRTYADDAVIIPPSLEILSSAADIDSFWTTQVGNGAGNFQLDTIYLKIDGDTAYQTAIWSTTLTNANGDTIDINSDMTNVLVRQQDGSWKIRLQSWN